MKNSENLINGGFHIKVNKKPKSINIPKNYIINNIQISNDRPLNKIYTSNSIFNQIKNERNSSENGIIINNLTEDNYPLTSKNNDQLKYNKININKRFDKNANKLNYTSFNNTKYKKNFDNNNNGNKIYLYKSETQYPFCGKKETIIENENKSMKNLNNSPGMKRMNLKYMNIPKKYKINQNTEIRNKKYLLNDDNNNINNNSLNKNDNKLKYNKYSELTFNKLRHNFYKPFKKESANEDNNYSNIHQNTDNNNYNNNNSQNNRYYSHNTNKYFNRYKMDIESNDKKLLNIYKTKLINIFVKLMTNYFCKYIKKLFNEFIYELRQNMNNKYNNKVYKAQKLTNYNGNKINEDEDENKSNLYYIKKKYSNFQENNKNNFTKCLSSNKNYSTMTMYRNKKRNKNVLNNNDIENQNININNKTNIEIDNDENIKKSSAKNLYIPAKNRNNNNNYDNNNHLSRQKDNIFNELKINKSTRLFERNPSLYQNQNINTQINNFYNTNNSNFYINKINSFSSIMIEKQKPKLIIFKNNNQKKVDTPIDEDINEEKSHIRCKIFKNNKKYNNIIYKKILSSEKNSEIKNNNKNDINIFMKRMERVYNKNKNNKNNEDEINQTYSIRRKYINQNKDININQFSTVVNYTNDNNESNYNNNIDISNDLNNYNLEDIDKPMNMNMMYMKNSNEYEEEGINNDENEIKNLLQIITNDKRLFLNFNYKTINKYNKNIKLRKKKLFISKLNPIYIQGKNKNKNIEENNTSFKESPENINRNVNKYIKKRKIKSGILKLDNFINDKIYDYKLVIFKNLKRIKFRLIIYHILKNHSINLIKKYFGIFKNNAKKEKKEIKNKILDKKNINLMIDDNQEITHIKNKEKLKSLFKKININKNRENRDENNNIIASNDGVDKLEKFENENINYKMPLWKPIQNLNINSKKEKNVYMKKNVKLKYNNSNKNNNYIDDNSINERKIDIFRNKLINYLFCKK